MGLFAYGSRESLEGSAKQNTTSPSHALGLLCQLLIKKVSSGESAPCKKWFCKLERSLTAQNRVNILCRKNEHLDWQCLWFGAGQFTMSYERI